MIISLDFDGCIGCQRGGWTGYRPTGAPIPGAREFIRWAQAEGHAVIISSCRALTQLGRLGIAEWLEEHDFPPLPVTCEKVHADVHIDDRGLRFNGCWQEMRELLHTPVWFGTPTEPTFEP